MFVLLAITLFLRCPCFACAESQALQDCKAEPMDSWNYRWDNDSMYWCGQYLEYAGNESALMKLYQFPIARKNRPKGGFYPYDFGLMEEQRNELEDSPNPYICKTIQKKPWSYDGANGPAYWHKRFPQCSGQKQSPIRFAPSNATHERSASLEYIGYNKPIDGTIENNGHVIKLKPRDGIKRGITVDFTFYRLEKFHFHFGSSCIAGSEHRVEGSGTYVMEMHAIHKNDKGRFVILALFFQEVKQKNKNLNDLIDGVKRLRYEGDIKKLKRPVDISGFAMRCNDTYYRYDGSFTAPPCTEGIVWLLLKHHVTLNVEQLMAFQDQRSLRKSLIKKKEKCMLQNNVRPVQPKNGRVVALYNQYLCKD